MKFTAVGDMIIQRRIQRGCEGYNELIPFITRGDARFFNLETTLNREGECCASQFSGGTYLRADPEVLDDVKLFGFNMTTFNNNHALDFSYSGFLKLLKRLMQAGLYTAVQAEISPRPRRLNILKQTAEESHLSRLTQALIRA